LALAIVTVSLFLPLDLLLLGALREQRPEASVDRWVKLHAQTLPQSQVDLKALPIPYRKRVLAALPADVRATLWRGHLLDYRGAQADLTPDQIGIIERAVAFSTSARFGDSLDQDGTVEAAEIEAQARRQFSPAELVPLFFTFGPDVRPRGAVWDTKGISALTWWLRAKLLVEARSGSCDCAVEHDWCGLSLVPSGSTCERGLDGCSVVPHACGFMLVWDCDGGCKSIIQ